MTTEEYVQLKPGDIVELHHLSGTQRVRKILILHPPGMDSTMVLLEGYQEMVSMPRVTIRDHGFHIGRWDNTV